MTNEYIQFKDKQQKAFNEFPVFFAFSNKQFDEGLEKMGWAKDDICSMGLGGFILKSDRQKLADFWESQEKDRQEAFKNNDFLIQAFEYELGNHEYVITYCDRDAIEAVGVKMDDRANKCLKVAKERYMAWQYEFGELS